MHVISVTYSICLVSQNLQFFGIQGYIPLSECDFCSVSSKLNFFSFTGQSNARFDGMVKMSMTFSTCVVYKILYLGTINFLESKAIAQCRSAIFAEFGAS